MIKEAAPFQVGLGKKLQLHIFIDKSVIEIFANNRQAISRRVYPGRTDSTRVILYCEEGEAAFNSIQTWEMMPANPY
jgi:beta-fructofuranosidase